MKALCRPLAMALVLALAASCGANDDQATTTILIPKMDCEGCAKKVAKALTAVQGVASVTSDVEKHRVVVTPKNGAKPSAKAMWEALEKAKYPPEKLIGPSGTFEEKPKE